MRRPLRYTIDADSLAARDNYHDPEEVDAYIDSIEAERNRLREAASWFMGMSGDFPAREAGDPPYWFRLHFRKRFTDICNALQEAGECVKSLLPRHLSTTEIDR